MENKEFKTTFLERLSYQLKNVWNEERVLKRINEIYRVKGKHLKTLYLKVFYIRLWLIWTKQALQQDILHLPIK